MVKTDNLEKIRELNMLLIDVVPIEDGMLCNHPYTTSPISMATTGNEPRMIDLRQPEDYAVWRQTLIDIFKEADLIKLFTYVRDPYKLTWLKYAKPFMTKDTFSEYLASAWVQEENPNMDANVRISTLIGWFRNANKKKLMTEEDYQYWENLPETVTVYRGVSPGREKYGLSWTDSEEKARWFQHRFENWSHEKKGILLKAVVPKEMILAYLNTRDEQELVLDVNKAKKLIEVVE